MKPPSPSWNASISLLLLGISLCLAEERGIYLVLKKGEAVAFHKGAQATEHNKREISSKEHDKLLERSHDKLLQRKLKVGSYSKLYSYTHIANGFAIHTTPSQVHKLKSAHGVSLIEEDRGIKCMTTYTPHFLGLSGAIGTWAHEGGEGNAGDGVVIGVIDTGIDPRHPSFAYDPLNPFKKALPQFTGGACEVGLLFPPSSCNGKIVSARYFAAGAAALMPPNASKDFMSPYDAAGHGSHVASTAAGNARVPVIVDGVMHGWASGMAPRARIAVYKAVYPDVGTLADLLAAIDQAARDGVDIITLSVGPDEPPEDTITFLSVFDMFLLFATRAGIFVAQAAGNKGPVPSTVVSFSPWAVGVGSSTTDRSFSGQLILGDGQKISGVGLSGPTSGNGNLQFRLILAKDAMIANGRFPPTPPYVEECQYPEALNPMLVFGSVVICSFSTGFLNGTSTLSAIFDTARQLGFMGFVFIANQTYGSFIAQPIPFPLPGIMIPNIADVQVLMDYYNNHTYRDEIGVATIHIGTASIGEGRVASFGARAPIVSRFSSRGPDIMDINLNPADVLKPDIVAPGDLIWAAWSPLSVQDPILSGHNFALLSGTSMATPHVAGIAALIKQFHPSWTPSMIASAITTTAYKHDNHGNPILAEGSNLTQLYPSTPFDHGAGIVNPSGALDPGLVFSSGFEDYIDFLCSLPDVDPKTVQTSTGKVCNLSASSQPSDLNLPSITISSLNGSQLTRRTVMNVASKPETYLCSVLQPEGVEVTVHPQLFTIAPSKTQELEIKLKVTQALNDFSFGKIVLTGSLDHIVRLTLSVFPISVAH